MQYVRLAVPQKLYKNLGFVPEMSLVPSSDMKTVKIVPLSSTSQLPSFSDSSVSRINLYKNSGSSEPLQSNSSAPFRKKSDNIVENASTLPSDLDLNNQTDLGNETPVEVDMTPAIDVEKGNKSGDASHNVRMESCQNLSSDNRNQMIERDSEESNSSLSYREERESPQGKILESKETDYKTVNIPISTNSLNQGCASIDNGLVDGVFDNNLSCEKIGKMDCSFKDPVSCEEPSIDGNGNDSSENLNDESDLDSASEDPSNPPPNSEKVRNQQLQSDSKIISSKKAKLNVKPQSNKIPFIKVCDNCCRTYKAKKTFQRHKKNCERFKAELVSGKEKKAWGSVKTAENEIVSDIGLKGPKTINHLIWKNGPRVDITCEKCHWKFFSLHRYERHFTYCKTLQTRGTDILDNSIEKDKSVKWIHAPTESTKKAQHYFVLRR